MLRAPQALRLVAGLPTWLALPTVLWPWIRQSWQSRCWQTSGMCAARPKMLHPTSRHYFRGTRICWCAHPPALALSSVYSLQRKSNQARQSLQSSDQGLCYACCHECCARSTHLDMLFAGVRYEQTSSSCGWARPGAAATGQGRGLDHSDNEVLWCGARPLQMDS